MRPRLLDLFCCAGGAARGYQRAGFHVTGVDLEPQPRYAGDVFVQGDALEYVAKHGHEFVAIHASPPCQSFTAYRRRGAGVGEGYPDLVAPTRELLRATGLPYAIENVPGAPLENPVTYCGSMFGLDVQRHRLFESNVLLVVPECDHTWWTPRFAKPTNNKTLRRTVEVGVWRIPLEVQQRAMGIDWMPLHELTQAIPPAYTEHVGRQLMAHVTLARAAA